MPPEYSQANWGGARSRCRIGSAIAACCCCRPAAVHCTALVFGLSHTGLFNPSLWRGGPVWPWGLWTFFGGLVYAYVREKTGSVWAGAIAHGLPQAIATAFMAF